MDQEKDYKVDHPMMCRFGNAIDWRLHYYYGEGLVYCEGKKSTDKGAIWSKPKDMIPFEKFKP